MNTGPLIAMTANMLIFGAAAYFFGIWSLIPVSLAYLVGLFHASAS